MDKDELLKVRGGEINASMLNSIARFGAMLFELGRSFGTVIIRIIKKKSC